MPRTKRFGSKNVVRHLRGHLGEPFAVLQEEVAWGVEISVHGFFDTPLDGQVTLVTEGLSSYFRERGSAGADGFAQELLMVVDRFFFGEEMLNFFLAAAAVYAGEGNLLTWQEPIRLSSGAPAGKRLRLLLAMPAAVFDEEFSFVQDGSAETNFCMLVPVHDSEVDYLLAHGPDELYGKFEEQDVDVSDLDRPALRLTAR